MRKSNIYNITIGNEFSFMWARAVRNKLNEIKESIFPSKKEEDIKDSKNEEAFDEDDLKSDEIIDKK